MAGVSKNRAGQQAAHSYEVRADESTPPSSAPPRATRRAMPSWLSVALVILTCIGVLASTMTVWIEAALLNTDRFVALVGPVGRDAQTIKSLSHYVADQAVTALNIPQRTSAALPPAGQFLAGPLEQTVHDFVQTRTERLLNSSQGEALWLALERSIHAQLVAALRGQSSMITIANGTLSMDTLPLLAAMLSRLQQTAPGLIPSGVTIPDLSGAQSPEQERAALAQALGVQLAPDFGIVTLAQSDVLQTAQRIVTTLDTLKIALPILTLALTLITIWFAADRRRTLLLMGVGTSALALLAMLMVQIALSTIPNAVTTTLAREITDSLLGVIQADLLGTLAVVLIVSALVALGAYVAGRPAWLMRLMPRAE